MQPHEQGKKERNLFYEHYKKHKQNDQPPHDQQTFLYLRRSQSKNSDEPQT